MKKYSLVIPKNLPEGQSYIYALLLDIATNQVTWGYPLFLVKYILNLGWFCARDFKLESQD